MSNQDNRQAILDEEHLKLLAIGYWVAGGMAAFFSLFGLFYIGMGAIFAVSFAKLPPASVQLISSPQLLWAGSSLASALRFFWQRARSRR